MPSEVLLLVFWWLPIPDLRNCLQVSKQWRQVLQANASVWRGARYHKTPELSIPPPPPGFPEWRYGTWIYGSRICTFCGSGTNNLPWSTTYRLVFCSEYCAISFCRDHVRSPRNDEEWARAQRLLPAPRRLYLIYLTAGGVLKNNWPGDAWPRDDVYIDAHLTDDNATTFLLSTRSLTPEEEAKRNQIAGIFQDWVGQRHFKKATMYHFNLKALKNWLLHQDLKRKLIVQFPRVHSLLAYLEETHQQLNNTAPGNNSQWLPMMVSIIMESLYTEEWLQGAPSEPRKDLLCARCVSVGDKVLGRNFQGIRTHLKEKHGATVLVASDLYDIAEIPPHFSHSLVPYCKSDFELDE